MKLLLTVLALHGLLSRAEECDPELFRSFPPIAQPSSSLDCPTATFVGVQPAKVVCSGQTTTTTLVWTYTDCEPTACVPLPDGKPILLDNAVDLGSGSKRGPPGLEDERNNANGISEVPGPNETDPPGQVPTDKLPNPADGSTQSYPPGILPSSGVIPNPPPFNSRFVVTTRGSEVPPNPLDPTATDPGTIVPVGSSSGQIPPPPTTGLLPISTDPGGNTISVLTESFPSVLPTSDDPLTPDVVTSTEVSSDSVPPVPTSSNTESSTDRFPLTQTTTEPPDPDPTTSTISSTSESSSSSAAPSPSCSDVPAGDFPDGVLAPWYISDQVTADSSTVVDTEDNDDHPYAFALIPSQDQRSQVYLNNYLPSCGDPPPEVTLQISFDYQFTGDSERCSIAVAVNRSPDNLVTVTDEGVEPGVWQSFQGEPITVQLTYDPLFTVKLLCEEDTANQPAILITDIKAYA